MREPAQVKSWLSKEESLVWIWEALGREAYRKHLAIWLTKIGPFYAHEVARMLEISKQAVWLWVSQCNKKGHERLVREGRRWSLLSWPQEEALLRSF